MNYTKPPLSIQQQIRRLKERGLIINDEAFAQHVLSNVSYYRLRAYTYPYQDNDNPSHPFTRKITFEEIIDLYNFDGKLRNLIFSAVEKIEIALRTKIIYEFSSAHGSHFHENSTLFQNQHFYKSNLASIDDEINRSKEVFIDHYFKTYKSPPNPPSWMSLEVISMGLLSLIFSNLVENQEKVKIINAFGHTRFDIFVGWIHSLVELRNTCAHHSRLWNRRFTISPRIPYNTLFPFLSNRKISGHKIYAMMCCIIYTLNIIYPENTFVREFKELTKLSSLLELQDMGFPADWKNEIIWQS